eukprot:TRINITY_DN9731_c0_g1_i1.p1 TRINITY_DN9731_c0_g1~~TRINITY_DN9731_c0_g1_i1.p1  ORF type:complete len:842 (-),score=151.64 TRINITY_DN9731_c0_g1_i1:40-2565(-)
MLSTFTVALAVIVVTLFFKYYKRTKKEISQDVIHVTEYILQDKHTQSSRRLVTRSVAMALTIILLLLLFAIIHYTYVALTMLTLTGIIISYFQTEKLWWHSSNRIEARFWTVQALVISFVILFMDNPFAIGQSHPVLACLMVVSSGFMAHALCKIKSSQYLTLWNGVNVDGESIPHFDESVKGITEMLSSLQYKISIYRKLNKASVKLSEKTILKIFKRIKSNPKHLNYVMKRVNLPLLIESIHDHRYECKGKAQYRTKILKLLCVDFLSLYYTSTKAVILDALQKFGIRAHPYCARSVVDIIKSCKSAQLLELRNFLDNHTEYYNFHHLVYQDLPSGPLRDEVLEHVKNNAYHAKRNLYKILSDVDDTLLCSGGHFPAGCDTKFPKGVVYPGAFAFYRELDNGYEEDPLEATEAGEGEEEENLEEREESEREERLREEGEVTGEDLGKGAKSGGEEGRVGTSGDAEGGEKGETGRSYGDEREEWMKVWKEEESKEAKDCKSNTQSRKESGKKRIGQTKEERKERKETGLPPSVISLDGDLPEPSRMIGNLVFISARPHTYRGSSEQRSYNSFREFRKLQGGLHANPILLAGDLGGIYSAWGNYEPIARKKYQNFLEYKTLYPEHKFLFIGDNGQGDVMCANDMRQNFSEEVSGVFIHVVLPMDKAPGSKTEDPNIHYFDNYIEAGLQAYSSRLIGRNALFRIIEAAKREWSQIRFANNTQAGRRLNELNLAITKVNQTLGDSSVMLIDDKPHTMEEITKEKSDIVLVEDVEREVFATDKQNRLMMMAIVLYPLLVSILVFASLALVVVGTSFVVLCLSILLISWTSKKDSLVKSQSSKSV